MIIVNSKIPYHYSLSISCIILCSLELIANNVVVSSSSFPRTSSDLDSPLSPLDSPLTFPNDYISTSNRYQAPTSSSSSGPYRNLNHALTISNSQGKDINLEISLAKKIHCLRREFTYKAVKTDDFGRKCWQYITVKACWGRCDSLEIADYRFPYKKSYHPVCIHNRMQLKRIKLENCHPGVSDELRDYYYKDALSCKCSVCRSSLASCEGPPYDNPLPMTTAPSYSVDQVNTNEVVDNPRYGLLE
ncbi:glycoprotein hormone beta 5 [Brevipalpus obovatus]|uniref:glycoprotein hormone beta 5 n=1 Tax=Brevipalpus obovatus TaxID=246614 RepID=UPI003D9E0933